MATNPAAAVAAPARTRPRAKPKPRARARRRSHAPIIWIIVAGVVLAGVVFVNLAVLRLNLGLDKANQDRNKLRAANAEANAACRTHDEGVLGREIAHDL